MRKSKLLLPALVTLTSGALYLLAKEDLKRKQEKKANFIDAIKMHGSQLIKDETLRDLSTKLLKKEIISVADNVTTTITNFRNMVNDSVEKFAQKESIKNLEKETLDIIDQAKEFAEKEI